MDTIKLKFYGNVIYIQIEKEQTQKLNTCKMTEYNEFLFSVEYINHNLDTLTFYINPLITNNNVEKIILQEKSLIPYIKKLANCYAGIHSLVIEENQELTVSDVKYICEMKYITSITCYDMDISLHQRLSNKYHKQVNVCSEILFGSKFMMDNHITTYSELIYKEEVNITSDMDEMEKEEFTYFIKNNQYVKKIIIKAYSRNTIEFLSKMLKHSKIEIYIWAEDSLTKSEYEYLRTIKKKYKINLQIEYSKNYQQKNAFKQLNLNLIRISMLILIVVAFGIAYGERIIFARDKDNTDEVIDTNEYSVIIESEPLVEQNGTEDEQSDIEQVIIEPPSVNPYYKQYTEKFAELKAINPDTIGWLKINNTNVNYPVVHTTDNEYYLNHSFDKSTNTFGWIYADYRSNFDVLNQNTILYGHNVIGTDLLLSTMEKIVEPSWYNNEENLTITFNTEKENIKWKIFSIYTIAVTNDYLITNFSSETSFLSFVQKLKDRSIRDFNIEISGSDKILTISTCYKDSSKRVVLHAKRIS